ncbi:two-component system response regulator [Pedobacter sp. SYSU D00535]|uniref:response regulator n=1 Tax=Pedobacter sp. SYSU D00535 TaxID=2810308 RepID=UPI001A9792D9|nr:response regulator [Pedobacter sp. SYSU D00535]
MTNKTIVVVDDDPGIVDSLVVMLEFAGYTIKTFTKGSDLFPYLARQKADLILLDVWLSGEDGKEICQLLRCSPATKDIPVIMLSASRDLEKTALEAGANDFLAKPFEMSILLEKINQFLLTK